ncbi:MAG TPA: hypothetical protein VHF27_03895 [Acidimicrobiales bacterium]|nr:hypothetical protein [Acidimicrobiales bacterium]
MEGHHRRPRQGRQLRGAAAALILAVLLVLGVVAAQPAAAPPQWERWTSLPGVTDVAGPRPDGSLVAAASGRLHLVGPDGTTSPFGSYAADPGGPTAIAVAHGLDVTGAGCRFGEGEVFVLERQGVVRVTIDGAPSPFLGPPPTDVLTGITFDATGRFGNQLLVAGRRGDRTVLFSVDCRGRLRTVTERAPLLGGGMAVAPAMFGAHGGDLVGADENTGDLVFIRFDGANGVLVRPELPAGPDVGAESVGFVPDDFVRRRGALHVAGGDGTIWRMTAGALGPFGVDENDLVVAGQTGRSAAVRCRATCVVTALGDAEAAGLQGHVTPLLGEEPPGPPAAGALGTAMLVISTTVIIVGGFVLFFLHNRKIREPGTS